MRVNYLLASTALTTSAAMASGTAVAQPATFTWTGWYVGLNAGGSSTKIEQDVIGPGLFAFSSSGRNSAFTGGIQGGYNWQYAPGWVAGIEVDSSYLRGERSQNFAVLGFGDAGGTDEDLVGTQNSKLRWLTTIRARFGPTWGRTFLYGTGGLAIGKVSSSVSALATANDGGDDMTRFAGSASSIRTGWTAGAGIEHAFTDRISAKIEYLHFDLGDISYNVVGTIVVPPGNDGLPLNWTARAGFSGDLVRVGVNFRIGP
jgi:outer membrane immunogenic protein